MAKYIGKDLFKYFSKFVEIERKTTPTDTWNAIYDKFFPEQAELSVGLKEAVLQFMIGKNTYTITTPRETVYLDGEEDYEVIIRMALEKIKAEKLLKKPKTKKTKKD